MDLQSDLLKIFQVPAHKLSYIGFGCCHRDSIGQMLPEIGAVYLPDVETVFMIQ